MYERIKAFCFSCSFSTRVINQTAKYRYSFDFSNKCFVYKNLGKLKNVQTFCRPFNTPAKALFGA